jgi:secretion/DNA translocation related TadE-like protein
VLGLAGVVMASMVAVLMLGEAVVAGARAQTAADLAALAGAQALLDHLAPSEACTKAEAVARTNGAHLETCTTDGSQRCEVTVWHPLGRPSSATTTHPPAQGAWATAIAGRPP